MAITVDGPTTESRISADGGKYVYEIAGLTGTSVQNLATALAQPSIPIKGQRNTIYPNLEARAPVATGGPKQVRVEVDWGPPETATRPEEDLTRDGDLTIGGGVILERVTTNRDWRGAPIEIDYDPTATGNQTSKAPDPEYSLNFIGETDVLIPRETMIVTRREDRFPAKISDFVGKLSDGPWLGNLRKRSNRHDWILLRATFPETQLKAPWFVTYEFAFNPETWNKAIYLIDPSTGAPYSNAGAIKLTGRPSRLPDPGDLGYKVNGGGVFRVQGEANFRQLNFRFARPRAAR